MATITPTSASASAASVGTALDFYQNLCNEFLGDYWTPFTVFDVTGPVLTVTGDKAFSELVSGDGLAESAKVRINRISRPRGLPGLTAKVTPGKIVLTLSATQSAL